MLRKYPRTFHLPWSLGRSDDDKVLSSVEHLVGEQVVITEKMDGENSTLYPTGKTHARSLDSNNHQSRDWLKSFWSERCYILTENMRVCGENLYARHSIGYNNLPSYFMGFSVWDGDTCLNWDDTLMWFTELDLVPVNTIYSGKFDKTMIEQLSIADGTEGYVVRLLNSFTYNEFSKSVAKCVRANHVQTDEHWMTKSIIKNGLI